MPQVLSDNGVTMEVLTDDGRTVTVPSEVGAQVLGTGAAPAPGIGAIPATPPAPQPDVISGGAPPVTQTPQPPLEPSPLPGALGPQSSPGLRPLEQGNLQPSFATPPGDPAAAPGLPATSTTDPLGGTPASVPQPVVPEPAAPSPPYEPGLSLYREATQLGVDGAEEEAAARERGFQRQAELYEGAIEQDRELQAQMAQDQEDFDQRMEVLQGEQAEMGKQYREAKVDPKRIWRQMSTGQEIMAWLGVALSGLGAAMKGEGGRNDALAMIQGAIDRDVQLQMAEIDKLGEEYAMKRQEIGDVTRMFDDRQARQNQLMANRWNTVGREAAAIEARTESEVVRPKAKQLKAQAWQNAATFERQAYESNRNFAEQQRQAVARERVARGQLALGRRKQRFMEEQAAKAEAAKAGYAQMIAQGLDPKLAVAGHGAPLYAASDKAKERIIEKRGVYYQLDKTYERYQKTLEEFGSGGDIEGALSGRIKTKKGVALKQAYSEMINLMRKYQQAGANFTLMEKELISAAEGDDPTKIAYGWTVDAVVRAREAKNEDYNSFVAGNSARPDLYVEYVPEDLATRRSERAAAEATAEAERVDQHTVQTYGFANPAEMEKAYRAYEAQAKQGWAFEGAPVKGQDYLDENAWAEAQKAQQLRIREQVRRDEARKQLEAQERDPSYYHPFK